LPFWGVLKTQKLKGPLTTDQEPLTRKDTGKKKETMKKTTVTPADKLENCPQKKERVLGTKSGCGTEGS